MKLSVTEAASLLGASEDDVYTWIEERALPAQRIRGQYRVNRAELLEWATERHIDVSPAAFEGDEPAPGLADALRAGGIHPALPSADLPTALREAIDRLPLSDDADRVMLREVLLAREAIGVTPVGNGIAIPHVRAPIIVDDAAALVSLSFLERPVALGPGTGDPIDTFFFLVSPTVHVHLGMLARLAHALRDPGFRAAVRSRAPEEILRIAANLDGTP